ncbi:hypothetical protein MASR2M15_29440 [Anaerolineales bacterium]
MSAVSSKANRLDTGRDKLLGAIIGQNAFIGVDVMTTPVKIGENAQIGPGRMYHGRYSQRLAGLRQTRIYYY